MNRPRESVLDLFDPLRADSPAAEELDTDKENGLPLISLPPSYPTPQLIPSKRRLVDIEELPYDKGGLPGIPEIDDYENSLNSPLSTSTPAQSRLPMSAERTPLAELSLTPTVNPSRLVNQPHNMILPQQSNPPPSGLLAMIEAVTLSKKTFAEQDIIATPASLFSTLRNASPDKHLSNGQTLLPKETVVAHSIQQRLEDAISLETTPTTAQNLPVDEKGELSPFSAKYPPEVVAQYYSHMKNISFDCEPEFSFHPSWKVEPISQAQFSSYVALKHGGTQGITDHAPPRFGPVTFGTTLSQKPSSPTESLAAHSKIAINEPAQAKFESTGHGDSFTTQTIASRSKEMVQVLEDGQSESTPEAAVNVPSDLDVGQAGRQPAREKEQPSNTQAPQVISTASCGNDHQTPPRKPLPFVMPPVQALRIVKRSKPIANSQSQPPPRTLPSLASTSTRNTRLNHAKDKSNEETKGKQSGSPSKSCHPPQVPPPPANVGTRPESSLHPRGRTIPSVPAEGNPPSRKIDRTVRVDPIPNEAQDGPRRIIVPEAVHRLAPADRLAAAGLRIQELGRGTSTAKGPTRREPATKPVTRQAPTSRLPALKSKISSLSSRGGSSKLQSRRRD